MSMLITISGLSGSGKSSAAKGLSELLGMPTVDIGQIFRNLAKKYGMDVVAFGKYAEEHPQIDRELDAAMVRRAKRGKDLILQGRLAGWMAVLNDLPATKIWIGASLRVRARRVAKRQGVPYKEAFAEISKRDRDNLVRYKQTYGLDLNDLSLYDICVQTDDLSVEQVVSCLVKELTQVWPTNRKPLKSPLKPLRPRPPRPPSRRPKPKK
jgi:cytidylate kinase